MSKFVSISELRDLTGKAHRTVVKALAPLTPRIKGAGKFYDSAEALTLLYAPKTDSGELNLTAERARLASAQANKVELDLEHRSGRLVDANEVFAEFSSVITAFRARILAVPVKAAPRIMAIEDGDPIAIQQTIRKLIYEALDEFSRYPDIGESGSGAQSNATAGSTSRINGESVVRSISEAKPRGERGTREMGDESG